MIVKLLTEHHLEFLSLKEARPSLHMSKCHIFGNLMHWLINVFQNLSMLPNGKIDFSKLGGA